MLGGLEHLCLIYGFVGTDRGLQKMHDIQDLLRVRFTTDEQMPEFADAWYKAADKLPANFDE